jgi:hypothetical protein
MIIPSLGIALGPVIHGLVFSSLWSRFHVPGLLHTDVGFLMIILVGSDLAVKFQRPTAQSDQHKPSYS